MSKTNGNGRTKKTLQSNVSQEEYSKFQKRLKQLSQKLNIDITESAYIKRLILEDAKKGDSP